MNGPWHALAGLAVIVAGLVAAGFFVRAFFAWLSPAAPLDRDEQSEIDRAVDKHW